MEGSLTLWFPDNKPLEKVRHPYQRTYKPDKKARWQTDEGYCNDYVKKTEPYNKGQRLVVILGFQTFYLLGYSIWWTLQFSIFWLATVIDTIMKFSKTRATTQWFSCWIMPKLLEIIHRMTSQFWHLSDSVACKYEWFIRFHKYLLWTLSSGGSFPEKPIIYR